MRQGEVRGRDGRVRLRAGRKGLPEEEGVKRIWLPAARVFLAAYGHELKCPRCGILASSENALKTCAGCGAPWRRTKDGYEFLCMPNKETCEVGQKGGKA